MKRNLNKRSKASSRPKTYQTTEPIREQSHIAAMRGYFYRHNLRDYALFIFGIYTGRRISDLVALNVRDVAYIDRRSRFKIADDIVIQERKTGKFIKLNINPDARKALGTYLTKRLKNSPSMGALLNEPLFKSKKARGHGGEYRITRQHVWRVLNKAARACGLNYKIGTHSLRKTFGYHLYNGGMNIEMIQKVLNHSSPDITLDYIGITQDDINDHIMGLKLGTWDR